MFLCRRQVRRGAVRKTVVGLAACLSLGLMAGVVHAKLTSTACPTNFHLLAGRGI